MLLPLAEAARASTSSPSPILGQIHIQMASMHAAAIYMYIFPTTYP